MSNVVQVVAKKQDHAGSSREGTHASRNKLTLEKEAKLQHKITFRMRTLTDNATKPLSRHRQTKETCCCVCVCVCARAPYDHGRARFSRSTPAGLGDLCVCVCQLLYSCFKGALSHFCIARRGFTYSRANKAVVFGWMRSWTQYLAPGPKL